MVDAHTVEFAAEQSYAEAVSGNPSTTWAREVDNVQVDIENAAEVDFYWEYVTGCPSNLNSSTDCRSFANATVLMTEMHDYFRREAGTHTVRFDAETLPSEPYLLRLETASHRIEKTMILQR